MSAARGARQIRIGIVGAGANTRAKHIPYLQKIPGVKILTVCNRSEASSKAAARAFGIPRIAHNWREIVRDKEIDAVVIGTWPHLHAEASIEALRRGKHVLTEARMAATLKEARRMLAALRRHPLLVAQVVPAPMSLDVDKTVKRMLQKKELGVLREVVVNDTSAYLADSKAPMHWRQDIRLNGINIMSLGIIHEIIERWLNQDPIWVIADANIFTRSRIDPQTKKKKSVEIPDSLTVLGRFRSGLRLIYYLSGLAACGGRSEIIVNGSKACLRFDMRSGKLYQSKVGTQTEVLVAIADKYRRGWRVEEDFIHSIRTGSPVRLTSFDDGLRYMAFVDAVWRSWNQGGRRTSLKILRHTL